MSNSPGVSDSGRHERRSNFSHTCSLLSQYLKEKGSFGDIFEPAKGQAEAARPITTMDLLPRVEMQESALEETAVATQPVVVELVDLSLESGDVQPSAARSAAARSEAAQMTMFYAGRVLVFDNFPADKAQELMLLASKTILPKSGNTSFDAMAGNNVQGNGMQVVRNADVASTSGSSNLIPTDDHLECLGRPPLRPADASDLPIPRKISLRRFIEKRKARVAERAPYREDEDYAKPKDSKSWLALLRRPTQKFHDIDISNG